MSGLPAATRAPSSSASVVIASVIASGRGHAGRLTLLDLASGRRVEDAAPSPCRHPVLSPDGRYIAFELGGDVALGSVDDLRGTIVTLAPALGADDGHHLFQFDATGDWIAVAVPNGVLILPTAPSVGEGRRFALPPGIEPAHLVWSETGRTLAFTGRTSEEVPVTLWLDPVSGQPLGMARGSEVLAVADDETVLTIEPREGRPAAQVSLLSRAGFRAGLWLCPEDRMIMGWLPHRRELVLSAFADDAGDPVDIVVAALGGGDGELRPLLHGVQGVRALPASSDGAWVAALLEDDPGAVHLVAAESGLTTRVEVLLAGEGADPDLAVAEAVCGPASPVWGGAAWG